jgi:hypothetical protein
MDAPHEDVSDETSSAAAPATDHPVVAVIGAGNVGSRLARAIGFDVADLGGPECVGMVEDAARLWIHLAFRAGWGRDFGFGVLRP